MASCNQCVIKNNKKAFPKREGFQYGKVVRLNSKTVAAATGPTCIRVTKIEALSVEAI
jgi:hypothetical protein